MALECGLSAASYKCEAKARAALAIPMTQLQCRAAVDL